MLIVPNLTAVAQYGASIDAILSALPQNNASHFDASRARFIYANLTDKEDQYPEGANHMFYNIFLRDEMHDALAAQYKYFMLLEADVAPIRAGWGTKLYDETRGDHFWMKGSQFHGRYLPKHIRFHINGNALYALGEPEFAKVLRAVKGSWSLKMGYDGCICESLFA